MITIKKLLDKIEGSAIKKRRWTTIPNTRVAYFYVDIMPYKGKELVLIDGTKISKGDIVAELHVNNCNMPEVTFRNIKLFSSNIDEELVLLAKALEQEAYQNIKAIFGRTLLYAFVQRKGFEIIEIRNLWLRFFLNFWDPLIRKVYSKSTAKNDKKRRSKEIWMSRSGLLIKLGES